MHQPEDRWPYVMSSGPELPEPAMGQGGLFGPEPNGPSGPPMWEGPMEPMEPHEKTVGALVGRKHGKVRRPASEGSGSDFHHTRLKQSHYASEVLSFHWVHHQGVGLSFYGSGIHLGDQDTKAVKTRQLPGRQVYRTKPDLKDRRIHGGASGKKVSEETPEAGGATLVQ